LNSIDISAPLKGFAVDQYPGIERLKEMALELNHSDPDFYFELHVSTCIRT
jgi:hypothetical protein